MFNSSVQPTFLFHDYETFGTHPSLDRPAQIALIRTDINFNIIEDPKILYCKIANDYLPHPGSVVITGITPQETRKYGVNEAEFAKYIHNLFTVPNTCIVGYNNIYFDDEVTRHVFYRNFYDPYDWSWKNNNSRWDFLNVMRTCYALRPQGINWPKNENGFPSFRLEHLSRANNIEHSNNAHNAMSDVYATIGIAKLIKKCQPKLFNYLFEYRNKKKLIKLIDIVNMKPLVHISSIFGARFGNTSLVVPLAWHPKNRNTVIMVDLAGDMSVLLNLDKEVLSELLYTPKEKLNNRIPIPLKLVHINKCPVLLYDNILRSTDADRLQINREKCLNNLKLLRSNPSIRNKAVEIFAKSKPVICSDNVDTQLYSGFFNSFDRAGMNLIQHTKPHDLQDLKFLFTDHRIPHLMFNYRARNFPDTLNKSEQNRWKQHRYNIFTPEFLMSWIQKIETLFSQYSGNQKKQETLKSLWRYAEEIISPLYLRE